VAAGCVVSDPVCGEDVEGSAERLYGVAAPAYLGEQVADVLRATGCSHWLGRRLVVKLCLLEEVFGFVIPFKAHACIAAGLQQWG
jgi:hypothetical protein